MEIIFELENKNIDAVFIPDFRMPNHAEHHKVQWQLSNCSDKNTVDGLCLQLENKESIYGSDDSLENVRLLFGYGS